MNEFIESVLSSAIKTAHPETHFTSAAQIRDDMHKSRTEIMDAVYYLQERNYLTSKADGYLIAVMPSGLQYFEDKKRLQKQNFKNNFTFPLWSSLISGTIGVVIGAILGWLFTYMTMR